MLLFSFRTAAEAEAETETETEAMEVDEPPVAQPTSSERCVLFLLLVKPIVTYLHTNCDHEQQLIRYALLLFFKWIYFLLSCRVAAFRSAFEQHRHEKRFEQITIAEIEQVVNVRAAVPYQRAEIMTLLEVCILVILLKISTIVSVNNLNMVSFVCAELAGRREGNDR